MPTEDRARHVRAVRDGLVNKSRWGLVWLIGAPVAGVILAAMFIVPGALWQRLPESEPHGYDVLIYHLQAPREWFDAGRIVELRHNVYSYLPFNVEMHYLLAMHMRSSPWKGMFVAQIMHAMMMAVSVLAVYACARTSRRASAICAGTLTLCIGWTAVLAPIAYNEAGAILMLASATALLTGAMQSRQRWNWRTMLLVGLLLGFATGAKLPAGFVALGLIAGAAVQAIRMRWALSPIGLAAAGAAIAIAPWLARNAVWTGNPVFPERMEWFGRAHLSEGQAKRWRAAHSAPAPQRTLGERFRTLVKNTAGDWRFAYGFVPIGIIAVFLARKREIAVPMACGAAALLAFWLLSSHLQSRFLVLLVPLLACAIGTVNAGIWRIAVIALAAGAMVVSVSKTSPPVREVSTLVGLENMDAWSISVMTDAIIPVNALNEPVYLVGEGRVFWIPGRSERLRYRTVFDVAADAGSSSAEKWLDGAADDALVFVNWHELRRLSQTYTELGWVPIADDRFENEVMRVGELRALLRRMRPTVP
jgi:hypothetical protein